MNITRTGLSQGDDFVIVDNHAKVSQIKVAEITKVNQSTVSRWLCTNNLDTGSSSNLAYLSGYALKEFVTYLVFDAKRISKEVRSHNIKLLSDASDYGFQMLIDKMAGVNTQSVIEVQSQELTPDLVANTIDLIFKGVHIKPELIAGVKLNAIQKLNPQLAGIIEDSRQLLIQSSASDNRLMTPTQLGTRLNLTAQQVNKLLIECGLQVKNENKKSRKEPSYLPTDKGHEFCSFTLATGKNNDSTSYQQLLWYESVLSVIS
jgi:transcriptional regulator with XRE-family HTH domain